VWAFSAVTPATINRRNDCVEMILQYNLTRVLSDRENGEKSGNLVDRKKSGKSRGI